MSHDRASAPPPDEPAHFSQGAAPVQVYAFGPFRIDVVGRHLLREDTFVPLTAKVFDTLLFLVRNHERTVTKDELMQAVWPGSFVSDDSLVQNISTIRRALGDDPSQPRFIATLARRGYRFISPVHESSDRDVPPPVAAEYAAHREHASTPAAASRPALWLLAAAFVAGVIVSAVVVTTGDRGSVPAAESAIRFQESLPPGNALVGGGVLSPDSRYVAFVARDSSGTARLWRRALDAGVPEPVAGTEGAFEPFWSPDSQFIAFFAGGQLKRVGVSARSPRVLAATQRLRPLGGTWGPGDLILYADQGKIFSVNAAGGTPAVVVEPDRATQQGELRWPHFLPDGRRFLFFASSENPDQAGTYLGTLGAREAVRLIAGGTSPTVYAPTRHLLYVRERVLMAQRLDVARGQLEGDPMTVAGDVSNNAVLSATSGGLLAFSQETARGRLLWFDRTGKQLGVINVPKVLNNMALSPNNRQLLGASVDAGNWVMWLIDLDRNVSTQIGVHASFPAWAPDGSRFAFSSVRGGEGDVFVRSISRGTDEMPWLKTDEVKSVNDWSSDGRFIVFANNKRRDLWLLPTSGDRKPMPIVQTTQGRARSGKISPDGRWLAYASDETGQSEIYVQSFPAPGAKQRVSTNGGAQPNWRQDGRELFYLSEDHLVMVAPIQSGEELQPGTPQPLFSVPDPARQFVATKDGQRFLMSAEDPSSDRGSITVLTNWEAALRP